MEAGSPDTAHLTGLMERCRRPQIHAGQEASGSAGRVKREAVRVCGRQRPQAVLTPRGWRPARGAGARRRAGRGEQRQEQDCQPGMWPVATLQLSQASASIWARTRSPA